MTGARPGDGQGPGGGSAQDNPWIKTSKVEKKMFIVAVLPKRACMGTTTTAVVQILQLYNSSADCCVVTRILFLRYFLPFRYNSIRYRILRRHSTLTRRRTAVAQEL